MHYTESTKKTLTSTAIDEYALLWSPDLDMPLVAGTRSDAVLSRWLLYI